MTHIYQFTRGLLGIIIALTCATLHAQSVIVKATGAGAVHRSGTGAGSVRGEVVATETTYSSNRFSVWSDNTNVVVDNDSGLTWTRDANLTGTNDWSDAVAYCSNLTYATYSDWRLPSSPEFSRDNYSGSTNGLVYGYNTYPALPVGNPFTNVQLDGRYWTASKGVGEVYCAVRLTDGYLNQADVQTLLYFWPCRGP